MTDTKLALMKAWGLIVITGLFGLALVLMGLLFANDVVTMAGLSSFTAGLGAYIGGHTSLVQPRE